MSKILNIKIKSYDFPEEITLKQYLKYLLLAIWDEKEGFSGKRPFGNSGWEYDIYAALVKSNFVEGKLDECGCVEEIDEKKADELIEEAIKSL
jgi:hypothetical protein